MNLLNVIVDICGNASLLFQVRSGDGQPKSCSYCVIAENPVDGQPFFLLGDRFPSFPEAAAQAWKHIIDANWFVVQSAVEGQGSIRDVWRRDFGAGFSRVIKLVESGEGEVPGVALVAYIDRKSAGF